MRESIRDELQAIAHATPAGVVHAAEVLTRPLGVEAGRSLAALLSTALRRQPRTG